MSRRQTRSYSLFSVNGLHYRRRCLCCPSNRRARTQHTVSGHCNLPQTAAMQQQLHHISYCTTLDLRSGCDLLLRQQSFAYIMTSLHDGQLDAPYHHSITRVIKKRLGRGGRGRYGEKGKCIETFGGDT